MKGGGGLTWLGWAMLGVGGMLIYAGMTGQSLVSEVAAVLTGKSPKASVPVAPATPGGNGESGMTNGSAGGGVGGSSSGSYPSALPQPTYPAPSGGGSW